MAANRRWTKPARPRWQGGHPLARGCVFATAPWLRGARASDGRCDRDERTNGAGFIQGSIGGAYVRNDAGVAISTGTSVDPVWWTDPSTRSLASPANGRITVAVLWRPRTAATGATQALVAKRERPGFPMPGWSLERHPTFGNNMTLETASATAADTVIDPGALALRNTYLTIAGCTGQPGNVMQIFRDGALAGTTVPGAPDPAAVNTLPLSLFGSSAAKAAMLEAEIGMVAVWERTMPVQLASMLATDPFTLWRPVEPDEGDAALQTYFLAF